MARLVRRITLHTSKCFFLESKYAKILEFFTNFRIKYASKFMIDYSYDLYLWYNWLCVKSVEIRSFSWSVFGHFSRSVICY